MVGNFPKTETQREGRHAFAKKSALLSTFFSARTRSSSMMMRLDCSFGIFQSNSKCFNEGKGLKFGFSQWFPYDDICIFFFSSRKRKQGNLNKEELFISRGFPVYSAFPDWSFSSRWPNNYLIRCSNRFILVSVSACSSLPFKNLLLIFLINA